MGPYMMSAAHDGGTAAKVFQFPILARHGQPVKLITATRVYPPARQRLEWTVWSSLVPHAKSEVPPVDRPCMKGSSGGGWNRPQRYTIRAFAPFRETFS